MKWSQAGGGQGGRGRGGLMLGKIRAVDVGGRVSIKVGGWVIGTLSQSDDESGVNLIVGVESM